MDLVKSFHTSVSYFFAKIGFDTAENEPFMFDGAYLATYLATT